MNTLKIPSQDELKLIFDYCNVTGWLAWKKRLDMTSQWNGRWAGKKAGVIRNARWPYVHVSLYDRKYGAHRLIWTMLNGDIPDGMLIDHINGNGLDNRLLNLRLATPTENQFNRGPDEGRRFKGVRKSGKCYLVEIATGQGVLRARCNTESEAAEKYNELAKLHHGQFAKLNQIEFGA